MKALYSVLSQFEEKYFISGDLNKSKVIEDIDKYDEKLVLALINDPLVRKHYSKNLGEYTIIEINKLIETFEMDDFWMDSHTKYTKKIGLTSRGRFIDESTEVVLDFSYKDTILKAGMTKEDVEKDDLKPDEPFYNEVIASEEIDVMLDKKILVNAKKYDVDGVHDIDSISDEDNLIIKGNNLLALHTISHKYNSEVKSIIIDPPYYFWTNKDIDAFNYNSNFKLSTWLTFMFNRIEIAYNLLSDNGIMSVVIGKDGFAHLKLIMDEIFKVSNNPKNFISAIAWRKSDNQSNIGDFANVLDYILIYRKNPDTELNRLPLGPSALKEYRYEDVRGKFRRGILLHKTRGKHYYDVTTKSGNILKGPWMKTKEDFERLDKEGLIYWTTGGDEQPYTKIYLKDSKGKIVNDEWGTEFGTNQRGAKEIQELFGERLFDFPKPEKLLMNLIKISTDEDDLVLDFFMGSATTQAVAMKMNRRFIGIEQMDYINTVSISRLQKVIEGEQGGISKDVDWQGGGSFVYAELMEKSQGYIDQVYKAKDSEELFKIYHLMLENVDLNFKVDLEALEEILEEESSLDERKKLLLKVIDKNQLYYNYSEIDDVNVRDLISDTDYAFNQLFYKEDDVIG